MKREGKGTDNEGQERGVGQDEKEGDGTRKRETGGEKATRSSPAKGELLYLPVEPEFQSSCNDISVVKDIRSFRTTIPYHPGHSCHSQVNRSVLRTSPGLGALTSC